jgi:hypothetical protein
MTTIRAQLLTEEVTTLRQLSHTPAGETVSRNHCEKLMGCGFATIFSGTLTITPMGQAKLVYETTRANWFPRS